MDDPQTHNQSASPLPVAAAAALPPPSDSFQARSQALPDAASPVNQRPLAQSAPTSPRRSHQSPEPQARQDARSNNQGQAPALAQAILSPVSPASPHALFPQATDRAPAAAQPPTCSSQSTDSHSSLNDKPNAFTSTNHREDSKPPSSSPGGANSPVSMTKKSVLSASRDQNEFESMKSWRAASLSPSAKSTRKGKVPEEEEDLGHIHEAVNEMVISSIIDKDAAVKSEDWLYISPISTFGIAWDIVMFLAIVYTAVVTFYSASFLPSLSVSDWNFWGEVLVSVLYLVDLVLGFFTGYVDRHGDIVTSRKEIVSHYLKTWFVVDLIAAIPYILITSFVKKELSYWNLVDFIVLIKCPKIMMNWRQIRMSETVTWIEVKTGVKYSNALILRLFLGVLLISHWVACLFYFFSKIAENNGSYSWMQAQGVSSNVDCYIVSLYFTVTTVTTIGYGDVIPVTTNERIYVIFAMLVGVFTFALSVGFLSNLLHEAATAEIYYRGLLDGLQKYADANRLPDDLNFRIRRYFLHLKLHQDFINETQFLSVMTPALRAEANRASFGTFADQSVTLRGLDDISICRISAAVTRVSFAPGETVYHEGSFPRGIYVLVMGHGVKTFADQKQVASDHDGHIAGEPITAGEVFGEEGVLFQHRRSHSVVCTTFSDILFIPVDDLVRVVSRDRRKWKELRRRESIRLWRHALSIGTTKARMNMISYKVLEVCNSEESISRRVEYVEKRLAAQTMDLSTMKLRRDTQRFRKQRTVRFRKRRGTLSDTEGESSETDRESRDEFEKSSLSSSGDEGVLITKQDLLQKAVQIRLVIQELRESARDHIRDIDREIHKNLGGVDG